MANALANPLTDNEFMTLDTGFENSTMAADKPLYGFGSKVGRYRDDVIVGEDGNFYNEDGERVYYWVVPGETDSVIGGGSETKGIGQDRGAYYTESEIRGAWNAKEGMGYLKKQVSWEDYWGFIQERQGLIQTGDLPDPTTAEYMADYPAEKVEKNFTDNVGSSFGGGREEEKYYGQVHAAGQHARQKAMENWIQLNASLMSKYGIPAEWRNSDGDLFVFNGSTFSRVHKAEGPDYGKMFASVMIGAFTAGVAGPMITSALTSSLGAAGAKAASSAIINLAKSYVTTGELSIEDALLSAALSYGGSELSDALQGSGVIGDIGSKITDFGNDLASNGGDILTSALTAGGMSLVTQMVKDGEIEWKDAAIAAAMAGGTTALKGFLADIGKADSEGEVLEEIKVTAQHKGTKVGEDMYQLEDGTVIYAPADGNSNVLGNMADLDTDGDGFLNANDLQEIDVTHDYVDENYVPYKEAYAGKDDVYVDANGRPVDPVGIKYSLNKDGYVDGNGNLVTKVSYGDVYGGNADLGPVDNQGGLVWESHGGTDGVITFEDGRFYAEKVDGQWIGADGQVIDDPRVVDELTLVAAKAIDEPLRQIDYSDANGNVITYSYPPYELRDNFEQGQFSGLIFGPNGETQEVWYDPITNTEYIKAQGTTEIIAIRNPETPPEPVDPQDPDQTYKNQDTTDSSDSKGGGGGDIGSTGDPSTNGTAGPDGSTNPIDTPTPNPTTYPELVKIAEIAGVTVLEVISRLNSGETVDQITGKGNTPVTPPKTPETNNDHTLAGGSTGGNTDSGGDTAGDETGDETGGDTEGGGDNTVDDGKGGDDGVSDTGGNDAGDDTGGTVTHKIGGGTVAGGLGQGSGAGSGTGTGGGSGNGEGPGDGDGSGNGNGNGNGNGLGDGLGGDGGDGRPEWGPLFPTAPYRPFQRHTPKVARSLFGDLMGLGK